MSDTPRTDEMFSTETALSDGELVVPISFARQLERENAALRNEVARLNNQTNWVCSCGGTDCAGQRENTALREDRDRLDSGTIVLPVRGEPVCFVGTDLRAAIDAGMRKAQP